MPATSAPPHPVVTTRPWCGDCGQTRGRLFCDTCCYVICESCSANHEGA
ncbi:MAG: hypothetical protein M3Y91_06660 [Actinomycetota bacterium]|nr:hypothetical protein [Actinomycetota bacterium]